MRNMKFLLIVIVALDLVLLGCQIAMWIIERRRKK